MIKILMNMKKKGALFKSKGLLINEFSTLILFL